MGAAPRIPERGHRRLVLGLLIGAAAGLAAYALLGSAHPIVDAANYYVARPGGQIFLRLLLMVVVPLVFASVALGMAGLGDRRRVSRVGGKAVAFFLGTALLASALGVLTASVLRPGDRITPEARSELMATYAAEASATIDQASMSRFGIETLVNIVPGNPLRAALELDLLAVMFFALVFGAAAATIPESRAQPILRVLDSLNQISVRLVTMILRLAPYGVACLMFGVTSRFGGPAVSLLGWFILTVLGALAAHMLVTLSLIVRLWVGMPALSFFSRTREALATAFATSSSSATLPTALAAAELDLGIPPRVAGFVLPLGTALCMNGTAVFHGVAVATLAQAFSISLGPGELVALTGVCVFTSVAAAGIPGGSMPLLIGALRLFDVPVQGIGLIIGVDRLLDMARTTVNVAGAIGATAFVARSENVWNATMLPAADRTPGVSFIEQESDA